MIIKQTYIISLNENLGIYWCSRSKVKVRVSDICTALVSLIKYYSKNMRIWFFNNGVFNLSNRQKNALLLYDVHLYGDEDHVTTTYPVMRETVSLHHYIINFFIGCWIFWYTKAISQLLVSVTVPWYLHIYQATYACVHLFT